MLPPEVTREFFAAELEGASAWAERHGLLLTADAPALQARLRLIQPETDEVFYLQGLFDQYKELPPIWQFCNDQWQACEEKRLYPKPKNTTFGSSMFIFRKKPVICAPFNRLAYAQNGGPHGDWSISNWMAAGGKNVRAVTMGDMLQAMRRDFVVTRGRMG